MSFLFFIFLIILSLYPHCATANFGLACAVASQKRNTLFSSWIYNCRQQVQGKRHYGHNFWSGLYLMYSVQINMCFIWPQPKLKLHLIWLQRIQQPMLGSCVTADSDWKRIFFKSKICFLKPAFISLMLLLLHNTDSLLLPFAISWLWPNPIFF